MPLSTSLSKVVLLKFSRNLLSLPFVVSIQKSGKKRLIMTFVTFTNSLTRKTLGVRTSVAKKILRPTDYMLSFDLKSGYHHLDIFPDHQK